MKKLILFSAIFCLPMMAIAQVGIGLKAGANYANISGADVANPKAIIGFHAGGVVELGIISWFSLQPELLYSGQGGIDRINVSGANLEVERYINYLQLPVLAKVYILKGLSLEAGPQIGFAVSSESKFGGTSLEKGYAENLDYGFVFGAGFKLDNGLFFQARYNYGLAEVEDGFDVKNRVAALSVGYYFINL